jgi:hypothetical protein
LLIITALAMLGLAIAGVVVLTQDNAGNTDRTVADGETVALPSALRAEVLKAYDELCGTIAVARAGDVFIARDRFFVRSHEQFHTLIDWLRGSRPGLADPLETSKNNLEITLGYLFQGRDPMPDLRRVSEDAAAVLRQVAKPGPRPCE